MDNAEDGIDFDLLLTLFADAAETITEPGASDVTPPWLGEAGLWPGLTMPTTMGPIATGSHALDPLSDPFADLIHDMGPFGFGQGSLPPLATAQKPQPMPNFGPSLGQAPLPAAPNPAASPPSKSKKRPSHAQQVQELEQQLERQELLAKSLAMSNIWLSEKQRVIELIIQANDGQMARGGMVQRGLDFNPFVGLKTTIEAVRNATPKSIAETILTSIGTIAMQLAAVQPLLQTNPHLLTDSKSVVAPHVPSTQPVGEGAEGQRPASPPAAKPYLPELVDHSHAHMMPELRELLDDVRNMCVAWSFLFLVHPKLLQANNIRLHALQGSSASWETLASSMLQQQGRSAPVAGRQGQVDPLPVIAPEVQWRNTVASLKLTDRQRLRSAVLWNVIDSARKKVHQQRAQLGAAMSQLLQPPTPPPLSDPAAAAAAAAATAFTGHGIMSNYFDPRRSMSGGFTRGLSSGLESSISGGFASDPGSSLGSGLGPALSAAGNSPKSGGTPTSFRSGSDASAGGSSSSNSGAFARLSVYGGDGGGGCGGSECSGHTDAYARAAVWKTPAVLQQEEALLEQLQHTLIKERCLILLGHDIFFRQILTPVQDAVALVSSYPYMPDQMAIIGAAATEFQPDVLDRLVSAVAGSTTPGIHLNQLT